MLIVSTDQLARGRFQAERARAEQQIANLDRLIVGAHSGGRIYTRCELTLSQGWGSGN